MASFHITPDGPRLCRAQTAEACPYGQAGGEHFSTMADAQLRFEENHRKDNFRVLRKIHGRAKEHFDIIVDNEEDAAEKLSKFKEKAEEVLPEMLLYKKIQILRRMEKGETFEEAISRQKHPGPYKKFTNMVRKAHPAPDSWVGQHMPALMKVLENSGNATANFMDKHKHIIIGSSAAVGILGVTAFEGSKNFTHVRAITHVVGHAVAGPAGWANVAVGAVVGTTAIFALKKGVHRLNRKLAEKSEIHGKVGAVAEVSGISLILQEASSVVSDSGMSIPSMTSILGLTWATARATATVKANRALIRKGAEPSLVRL